MPALNQGRWATSAFSSRPPLAAAGGAHRTGGAGQADPGVLRVRGLHRVDELGQIAPFELACYQDRGAGQQGDFTLPLAQVLRQQVGGGFRQAVQGMAPVGQQLLAVNMLNIKVGGQSNEQKRGREGQGQSIAKACQEVVHGEQGVVGNGPGGG